MDKNLRAELSALKEEVLANLKGLEKVIANIDSKLTQTDEGPLAAIEDLVDPTALEEARAWVRDWDDAWERSIIAQRDRTNEFLNPTPFKDPLGKKDLIDMFKEARKWDDWTYELFTAQWTKGKKRRIDGAKNTINTFIADAKARKGWKMNVEDLSDARRVLEEMERFDAAKIQMYTICEDTIKDLDAMLGSDDQEDFVRFYDIMNDLLSHCNAIKAELSEENVRIFGMLLSLLTDMLEANELEQFEFVALDPTTFDPVKLEREKLVKYRAIRLREYKRDLKDAFEFRESKKIADSV